MGICAGRCDGGCAGLWEPKDLGKCDGICTGACIGEVGPPVCTGEFNPPGVDPICQAMCAAGVRDLLLGGLDRVVGAVLNWYGVG